MYSENHIEVRYYIKTRIELEKAADTIAALQSIGVWSGIGERFKSTLYKYAARVIEISHVEKEKEYSGFVKIAFPYVNFGFNIPNLLSTIAGELYEMNIFISIKLLDIEFPSSYLSNFIGPKFGIKGCRDILKIYERPIIGSIIKPCVGLSAGQLAELAYEGFSGGIDFIKDDELLADASYNTVSERVKKVTEKIKQVEDETGEKKMYAFNVTGRLSRLKELHDTVVENGGKCIMINAAAVGFEAMRELAEYSELPIHCHRVFSAILARNTHFNISFPLLTKLYRLCGADQIHCGAIQGKLFENDDEVLLNMNECIKDFHNIKPAMPVSSGGQWAASAPVNAAKIGHYDFIHLAGSGIYSHPDGPFAGARSMRQAWDAVIKGVSLEEYSKEHIELRKALDFFGTKDNKFLKTSLTKI
ncbi:MAG: hypothetical protein HXY52_03080 [Nitrospirae bacterium]|jgi:ribulose-bisphosphate carboxylase large chain|nr:hypothetical protein [Nitrospirota bacterium]